MKPKQKELERTLNIPIYQYLYGLTVQDFNAYLKMNFEYVIKMCIEKFLTAPIISIINVHSVGIMDQYFKAYLEMHIEYDIISNVFQLDIDTIKKIF